MVGGGHRKIMHLNIWWSTQNTTRLFLVQSQIFLDFIYVSSTIDLPFGDRGGLFSSYNNMKEEKSVVMWRHEGFIYHTYPFKKQLAFRPKLFVYFKIPFFPCISCMHSKLYGVSCHHKIRTWQLLAFYLVYCPVHNLFFTFSWACPLVASLLISNVPSFPMLELCFLISYF